MQTIHHQANQSLEKAREVMGRYYDRKAKQQPDFKIGDMVILNAKNIHTKHSFKKLAPKLYSPFKILEQWGELRYKLKLSECSKIYPIFHISLFEPYQTSTQPTREQLPMKPEGIDSYLEWEVEKIFMSEIISYNGRVPGRTRTFKELRSFICKKKRFYPDAPRASCASGGPGA